jgi:NAD(P)-dependent dehydrogenase (short-subunit alcohol dehydrogenase family)
MDVNVTGAFHCIREAVPMMMAARFGRIVIMSSATVRQPPSRPYVHYITSKAALVGMTRALAKELGEFGITVNAILPGSIETGVARPSPVTSADRAAAGEAIPGDPARAQPERSGRHRPVPGIRCGCVHHRPVARRRRRADFG